MDLLQVFKNELQNVFQVAEPLNIGLEDFLQVKGALNLVFLQALSLGCVGVDGHGLMSRRRVSDIVASFVLHGLGSDPS